MMERANDAILILDGTLQVVEANPAAVALFGIRDKGDLLGRGFLEMVAPEDRDAAARHELGGSGSTCSEERRMHRSDGSRIVTEVSLSPIRFGKEHITIAVLRDIAERKAAEEALRRSQALLQIAGRMAQVGAWVLEAGAMKLTWSDQVRRIHEVPPDYQPELKTAIEWYAPEYRETINEAVSNCMRDGTPWDLDLELITAKGRRLWVRAIGEAERDEGGAIQRIHGAFQDISGPKKAEQAIKEQEAHYRMLFDSNPHAMWVYDRETLKFLQVNEAAVEMYGYSAAEFASMTIMDIRPPDEAARAMETVTAQKNTGQNVSFDGDWRHLRRDGTILHVRTASNRVDFHNRPARLVLALDVSDRKRLELQLLKSQKMEAVGQLAGGLAHDFNNLLGVIVGYGELLSLDLGKGSSGAKALDEIMTAANRASELTRQLLAFSRKQVMQPKTVNLNEVVGGISNLLHRLIGDSIQFKTKLAPDLGSVVVDPGQFEQVIVNLAANARDAMPEGGWLTIETRNVQIDTAGAGQKGVPAGEYVQLVVSDTGSGMDREIVPRIFEPFFTTKEVGKGAGMGLATAYGIVRQSSGCLEVYSEPGRGTTFRIYLPTVRDSRTTAPIPLPLVAPSRASETILVVDDARALGALVRKVLEQAGYHVLGGTSPAEALEEAARFPGPIHAVLTDVVMPEISGPDVVARLKVTRPRVRVLFMSGFTHQALDQQGVLEDGIHLIEKPFTADALRRRIREVLDAPHA